MDLITAYIGLGSNLGDNKANLLAAWQRLGELEGVYLKKISSPYMTAPVDMTSQHWFANAVGELEVTISSPELLLSLHEVEQSLGRKRSHKSFGYEDRTIDLDILYYGEEVIDMAELTVPHPRIKERLFVLVPLAEIAPDFCDTITGERIDILKKRLQDRIKNAEKKQQELIRSSWDS